MNNHISKENNVHNNVVILTLDSDHFDKVVRVLAYCVVNVWNNEGLVAKPNCILCNLADASVLQQYGYNATPRVVYMKATDNFRVADFGQPDRPQRDNCLNGHLVVDVQYSGRRYIIDSSISQAKRWYTPSTPVFAVIPVFEDKSEYYIEERNWRIASFGLKDSSELFAYFRSNKNKKHWRHSPDARKQRTGSLAKALARQMYLFDNKDLLVDSEELLTLNDQSKIFVAQMPFFANNKWL